MQPVRRNDSTSQRSWRQNLAQGEASAASGTLGSDPIFHEARFSGRKILSPAKAGSRITLWRAAGYAGSLSLVLLSLTIACAKKEPQNKIVGAPPTASTSSDNYPNLAAQAQEMSDAFARKDYQRFVDLTYPKVIEMAGGRDKMLSSMTQQIKEMEADGVVMLSSSSGAPTQFVRDSGSIYALLPMTIKAKAKDGIFQSEGSTIAVSSDGGANWTFVDASGKDHSELKAILPNVADQLKLPAEKAPVKISN